jgi:hypothetical protein
MFVLLISGIFSLIAKEEKSMGHEPAPHSNLKIWLEAKKDGSPFQL